MTLGQHVFQYCERGTSVALWAEPINAISNAGFLLAALIFWQLLLWRRPQQRSADHYLLMALVFLIGFGSLAFHLFATRGTELADVIPIGLFMLIYLGFALNRFLEVPPGWTVLLVIVFAGLTVAATQINCGDGVVGFAEVSPEAKSCLNGSVGYLPALGALIVIGMLLGERRHRAAPYVLAAAVIFIVSIILRSLDLSLCDRVVIEGRDVGTHFIWHVLNALVLFLLLRASLETGTRASAEAGPEPQSASVEEDAAAEEQADTRGPSLTQMTETAAAQAARADEPETPFGSAESELPQETVPEPTDDPSTAVSEAKDEPEEKPEPEEEEPEIAASEVKEKPEEKPEPEGEDETPTENDEKDGDALKPMTARAAADDAGETGEPQEVSSQEQTAAPKDGTSPDETPTAEDISEAVKALSTEDTSSSGKTSPRKRRARRKKPTSD